VSLDDSVNDKTCSDLPHCHSVNDRTPSDLTQCHFINDRTPYDLLQCQLLNDGTPYDLPQCHFPSYLNPSNKHQRYMVSEGMVALYLKPNYLCSLH
jgi:hypothetical protein